MEKKESLFAGNDETVKVSPPVENKMVKVVASATGGIEVNEKLALYLKKYVDSFDHLHDKIELKGKLIDLIRKL